MHLNFKCEAVIVHKQVKKNTDGIAGIVILPGSHIGTICCGCSVVLMPCDITGKHQCDSVTY